MATDDNETPEMSQHRALTGMLQRLHALQLLMICVCSSHPDRDALEKQVQGLFDYLDEDRPPEFEKLIGLIEDMSGFSRKKPDAPSV